MCKTGMTHTVLSLWHIASSFVVFLIYSTFDGMERRKGWEIKKEERDKEEETERKKCTLFAPRSCTWPYWNKEMFTSPSLLITEDNKYTKFIYLAHWNVF